jgi:hypothetical protein
MLPRAFRTLQSVSSCFRSPLSATEPLSDPLRKILEFEFALIQPQVNLLGFASHRCVCTGSPFGSGTVSFKESLRYRTQQRHISDQTAVKSDDLVVYEGPLSKAVLSLKVPHCTPLPAFYNLHQEYTFVLSIIRFHILHLTPFLKFRPSKSGRGCRG